jgi:hypothetical protein
LPQSKDRRHRTRDIADARIELEEAVAEEERPVAGSQRRALLAWIASLTAATPIVALAIPAVRHLGEIPPKSQPEMRMQIVTPYTRAPLQFALSPGRF